MLVRREGKLVHLEGPTTPRATELTIWLRPPVTLRGRLRDWQDQPIPAAQVVLRRIIEAGDRASQFSITSSDSGGLFAIQKLVRGDYVISASGKSRTGATVVFRKRLTLGIQNESHIDLRPAGRGRLSGTARLPPGHLTEDLSVPWQADFNLCTGQWWPGARPVLVMVDPGGSKTIDLWTRPFTTKGVRILPRPKLEDFNNKFKYDEAHSKYKATVYANQRMGSNQEMVDHWHKLGFIAPDPSVPGPWYIETERAPGPNV